MHDWLRGTGVALITPFDEQLQIDFVALKKLIEHVTQGGVSYLVILGTTGESVTISVEEKHKILSFVAENNPKNLPLVFGLGGYDTLELAEFMSQLRQYPLSAILSVTPYYNKPNATGLLRHYTYLADRSELPLILYNVPSRTGCNLPAATTLELARHSNIIGIKEASGDLLQCIEIARGMPSDFYLISGDDILTLPIISIGGCGVISVVANVYPASFTRMVSNGLEGRHHEATALLHKLAPAIRLTVEEGNPTGVKALAEMLGLSTAKVRMPLAEASKILKEKAGRLELG